MKQSSPSFLQTIVMPSTDTGWMNVEKQVSWTQDEPG